MRIRIVDITYDIVGLSDDLVNEVGPRYAEFATDSEPQIALDIEVLKPEIAEQAVQRNPDYAEALTGRRVAIGLENGICRAQRFDNPFEAVLEMASGSVHARMASSIYCFDSLLRILSSILLARRGGALLHGVGLAVGGRGHVMIGPSGSGKTTLARAAGDGVLSDELVGIAEKDGRLHAYPTPFWGEFALPHGGRSVELSSVSLLVQDETTFLGPIGRAGAALEMAACTLFFGPSQFAGNVLDLCGRITESVTVNELHFAASREALDLALEEVVNHVA